MPGKKMPVKLAIVDDHKLFRKGLINLINLSKEKYLILFEAENGKDMMNKLEKKLLPDIIIMDIDMPGVDGFQTVAWLKEYHPDVSVLVVSMVSTEEAIVRMLRLGVKGYLSKDIEPEDIHKALLAISTRGYYYTDFLTGRLVQSIQGGSSDPESPASGNAVIKIWEGLSEREREFVKYACSEKTYVQIADEMNLSPKTIDGYRENLFHKFGVKTRVGLALFAVKNMLVDL